MNTRGLTLIEIAIVIVLIGLIAAVAFPQISDGLRRQNVRSASDAIAGTYAKARAVAIQRGRRTVLEMTNGRMVIRSINPVTGAVDTVGQPDDLAARFNVTISAVPDTFAFDGRGIGLAAGNTTVIIRFAPFADTLRISRYGRIEK